MRISGAASIRAGGARRPRGWLSPGRRMVSAVRTRLRVLLGDISVPLPCCTVGARGGLCGGRSPGTWRSIHRDGHAIGRSPSVLTPGSQDVS